MRHLDFLLTQLHLPFPACQVLHADLASGLRPTVEFLRSLGLSRDELARALRWHPGLLSQGVPKLKTAVLHLERLGFGPFHVAGLVCGAPIVLDAKPEAMAETLAFLQVRSD